MQCALRVGDSILVGTNGKGLIILNSLGEVLSTSLTGYSINGIAKSKTEYFIASNKGVLRAKDNEETKSVEITGYINRADGLLSDEVNGVVQDSNKLYITSVDGLYSVDLLGLDALQELKPHLRIEEVLLDDSTQVESTVFGYNENNLTFKYNSISFFVFLLVQN